MSNVDHRLLTLAGILTEDMSIKQAYDILRTNGANTTHLDDRTMRLAVRGKREEIANQMIGAYNFIKKHTPEPEHKQQQTNWAPVSKQSSEAPPWAEGLSDWTIRKNDLTDANYVRKAIWEISGKPSTNPISLWVWDGERFGQHLVVLGISSKFKQMAKAMVTLSKGSAKAVFAAGRSNKFLLLYVDGRYLNTPVAYERNSNKNPNNDWDLVAKMPRILAQLTKKHEHEADDVAGDYKAWINTDSNKIQSFSVEKSYYDAIKENPKIFGGFSGRTTLQARIQIERAGWCAVGVNTTDEGTGAVVTALTPEHALKSARMLFRQRYKNGDWDSLKIKTNDDQFKLVGRAQIRDYLMTGKKQSLTGNEVYL